MLEAITVFCNVPSANKGSASDFVGRLMEVPTVNALIVALDVINVPPAPTTKLEDTITAAPAAPRPTASAIVTLVPVTLVLDAPPSMPPVLYWICVSVPPAAAGGDVTQVGALLPPLLCRIWPDVPAWPLGSRACANCRFVPTTRCEDTVTAWPAAPSNAALLTVMLELNVCGAVQVL